MTPRAVKEPRGGAAPRPEPGPPRPYQFPRFERRTLGNGMQLAVAPVHKLPLVTAIAVVDAGATHDAPGREGTASLVAALLGEGTATMDGDTLTLELERLGASLVTGGDWDTTNAGITVTRERLEPALRLLAEAVMAPSFPAREIERLREERLAEILQLRTEPRGLANEMATRFAYAPDARYSRPLGGTRESVRALGARDIGELYAARYRPAATTLVLAGDIAVGDATELADRIFGDWSGAPPTNGAGVPDTPNSMPRAVHLVAKPDAPQSELRILHPGIPRVHADYFHVVVMNAVLGGLFSSRINLNLRERNAYTYGARSEFDWRRGAGPFVVSTAVASDVTAAAAREALREIDRIRREPIDDDELSLATNYLAGVFPIRYETTAAIASALANLVIYGLDDDYFDAYRDGIRAVTAEDVLAAAQRHLHPERLRTVVVGDPATTRSSLEALDAGEVRVYDAEGRPIER
ncbi:MAG TPA: pitrilysin family protein [Gemmatimonadaceae bacterium]|nr:pitrilysin family protein [Gemmatimonadaceae bacterium]